MGSEVTIQQIEKKRFSAEEKHFEASKVETSQSIKSLGRSKVTNENSFARCETNSSRYTPSKKNFWECDSCTCSALFECVYSFHLSIFLHLNMSHLMLSSRTLACTFSWLSALLRPLLCLAFALHPSAIG